MASHAGDQRRSFAALDAMQLRRLGYCAALAGLLIPAGCGTPGAPQPPSLNLPQRVTDLSATRTGDQVTLSWSMPDRSTDKLIMKSEVSARICRREVTGPCNQAGSLMLKPGADATWSEALPPALNDGATRELRYFVELQNRNGRSAGLSDAAVILAGRPPKPVVGLRIEMRKQGAVLHWDADDDAAAVRLQRKLMSPAAAKPRESLTSPSPEQTEQSLLVEDPRQGQAIDKTVRFGEVYEYRAQRVNRATVDGKTLELAGAWSSPLRVEALDVFPPATPTGLVAVAVGAGEGRAAAIDLSWEPDPDADIAGYIVYRREDDGPWQRVSPAQPVVGPAFHDEQVQAGRSYDYAVSAVDRAGHESARSAQIEQAAANP